MKHVMIDLETLGTSADAVWLSIAAIQFDPYTGQTGQRFSANVDLASAQKAGRKISPSTLKWWLEQRHDILLKMLVAGDELSGVLQSFSDWVKQTGVVYPWGNSAAFDLGILVNSFTKADIFIPWAFYNERCYRTVTALAGIKAIKDEHKAHDPEYDCEIQIEALTKAYRILSIK